jgi:ABC-2 type transport system permease protein
MTLPPAVNSSGESRETNAAARGSPSGGFRSTPLCALFLLALRQYLHGKRPLVMGLLLVLPAGLVLLMRATASQATSGVLEFSFVFMFIPQALLPLVALVYALGILQDEQEAQTITYLLIRPIPKWALYIVKLMATVLMAVVLTAGFTALTYAAIYIGGDGSGHDIATRCLKAISIHSLTVIAYCCLFGLISLLTKWTLVACILYTAVIELLLANLPFSIRLITVIYYSRLIAYRTLSFIVLLGGRPTDIAAEAWQLDVRTDPKLLEHPQLATCVIVLLGGSLVCTLLAALLCSRREFYVKTPEQL